MYASRYSLFSHVLCLWPRDLPDPNVCQLLRRGEKGLVKQITELLWEKSKSKEGKKVRKKGRNVSDQLV